jgi:hypothetical protein
MARFLLVLVIVSLAGCSILTDRTKSIAALTLTNECGGFNEDAYNAAIQARYPKGTPIANVTSYVEQAGGQCSDRDGRLWCEIPVKTGLCAAHLLGIDVGVADGKVVDIKGHAGGVSC